MKLSKILMTSLIISTASIGVTAHANDYEDRVEMSVYQDANYQANIAKATQMLKQKGYTVKKIDADTYRTKTGKIKPALEVEAYKGYAEYDIKLSYPDLRIIKEKRDD